MRKGGNVPAHPVLVTLVGSLRWSNLTLSAAAGERYDWRPLAALDTEVFTAVSVPFFDLLATLVDIATVVPKTMVLQFLEGPRIHCGEMRAVPGEDFALFDWLPMAIGPTSYVEAAKIGKRISSEMGNSIPVPFDEAASLVEQVILENAGAQQWHA